jgi:hypothetical protein
MPKTKIVSQLAKRFENSKGQLFNLNTLHIESAILEGENIVKYESILYMPFESSFHRLKKMAHMSNLVLFCFFGEL